MKGMVGFLVMLFLMPLAACSAGDEEFVDPGMEEQQASLEEALQLVEATFGHDSPVLARPVVYATALSQIHAWARGEFFQYDTCQLAEHFDVGGGEYQVESIVGVTEYDAQHDSGPQGYTYVKLRLLNAWTADAPVDPVARVRGGPVFDEFVDGSLIELRADEVVGVLFSAERKDWNQGFYDIQKTGLFRTNGDDVTNDILFVGERRSLSDVGEVFAATYKMDSCIPLAEPKRSELEINGTDEVIVSPEPVEVGVGF